MAGWLQTCAYLETEEINVDGEGQGGVNGNLFRKNCVSTLKSAFNCIVK